MAREVIDIIIQQRGATRVAGNVRNIGDAAGAAQGSVMLLRTALGGLGGAFAVREVLQAVDSYQRMQNQLRVVGYETEQLVAAQQQLFGIAQQTRAPLEETVNLYGKLAQSAGELGKSQSEMMMFTELTGKALAIQGTSTSGSRAALLQLSQAMGEGTVRAQEYNSLIENARPLLVAAAKGMDEAGGSVAKLRSLVLEGEVSSREFFDAVLAGGSVLNEQFGQTIPTIGQAITVLKNSFTQFIGESQAGQTILSVVSGTLLFIADNFELIATVAIAAGTAFVAYWGAGVMTTAAAAIMTAARSQIALNLALGSTSVVSATAAAGIKAVQTVVRGLTAAIAANPLGFLVVAAIALITWLYNARDAMISFGGTTASVGSVLVAWWARITDGARIVWEAVTTLAQGTVAGFNTMVGAVQNFVDNTLSGLNDYLSGWGTTLSDVVGFVRDAVNTWIGLHVGFLLAINPTITQGIPALFRLAMAEAKNIVIDSLQGIVNVFVRGLGNIGGALDAIPGIDGVGDSIRESLTVDFSDLRADTAALKSELTAAGDAIQGAFSSSQVDYIGGVGAGIAGVGEGLESVTTKIFDAAAARDKALSTAPSPADFTFEGISAGAEDAGGGSAGGGGGTATKTAELTDLQKAYQEIVEQTRGSLKELVVDQQALRQALADGVIGQDQYNVQMQELRVGLAEWALEGRNVAQATREANDAILQLKIDAGDGSFADGFLLGLSRMTEGAINFTATSGELFSNYFSDFTDGFANSIGRAIVYSEDLGDALDSVAREALAGLISGLVKMAAQWVINAAIGKAIGSAATAATAAQAGSAAAAWAPAAALASLATGGTNAVAANVALTSTVATSQALAATSSVGLKDGGQVFGPGGPRGDKIPAMLSDKEFVVNSAATQKNLGLLQAINAGQDVTKRLTGFMDGGLASKSRSLSRSANSDINATATQSATQADQTANSQPVEVYTVLDPSMLGRFLQNPEGREVLVQTLRDEGVI